MTSLFWYQTADRTFTNRGLEKLFLLFRKFIGKPDHNAFVLLTANTPNGESDDKTQKRMENFIQELYPLLNGIFENELV